MVDIAEFKKICRLDSLKAGCGKKFVIDEVEIALFRLEEGVYAVSNICPHQHSAVIYDGIVEDGFVVCPVHGWKFSLSTGKQPAGYNGLDSYEVKIIDDSVYIKASKKEFKW